MIEIDESQLPDEFAYRAAKKRFDKHMIFIAHKRYKGNQTKMARFMGVTRQTVATMMKQNGLGEQ